VADIDTVGDLPARGPGSIELRWIEASGGHAQCRCRPHGTRDRFARERRFELTQRPVIAHVRSSRARHLMHPQVIGVAVSTRRVVADQHVRLLRLHEVDQARDLIVEIARSESTWCITVEPGVGESPGLQSGGAEDLRRALKLGSAHPGQIVTELCGGEARSAVRRHGEDHPVALG